MKNAWKIVASEGRSYAEAIKVSSNNQSAMRFIGSGSPRGGTCGRADVIEHTCCNSMAIPTAVRRQWAVAKMSPKTRSIETQTDEEPTKQMEQKTQTSRDMEVQTDVEPEDKKIQTTKDLFTQTLTTKMELERDDKFIMVTLLQLSKMLIKYAHEDLYEDRGYEDLKSRFGLTVDLMIERKYPIEPEKKSRKRTNSEERSKPETRQQAAKRQD